MKLDALAPFPVIRTERLVLRALEPTDVDAVFAIFGDDEVTRLYDRASMRSRDEANELLALLANRNAGTVSMTMRSERTASYAKP